MKRKGRSIKRHKKSKNKANLSEDGKKSEGSQDDKLKEAKSVDAKSKGSKSSKSKSKSKSKESQVIIHSPSKTSNRSS